jgi:hypothetical protein
MDGEPFYLEPPLNNSNPAEINTPINQPISNLSNNNISNSGKIIGNEVIQFQPSDIFDDLFNNDLKDKPKSIMNDKTLPSNTVTTNDPNNGEDFSNIVYNSDSNSRLENTSNTQNVSNNGVIEKS